MIYSVDDESLTAHIKRKYQKMLEEVNDKDLYIDHYGTDTRYERYVFINEGKFIVMIYNKDKLQHIIIDDNFRDFIKNW